MVKQLYSSIRLFRMSTRRLNAIVKLILICSAISLAFVFVQNSCAGGFYDKYYKNTPYGGWKYIVIHHSATQSGNAASFHKYHSEKGYGGLCYHFVIGNGNGAEDGMAETGFRWDKQMAGTHCTVNAWEYNIFGIGICLVGNLEEQPPTLKQMDTLVNLTAKLVKAHNIPIENIIGHKNVPFDNDPNRYEPTKCPGKHFPLQDFRNKVLEKI